LVRPAGISLDLNCGKADVFYEADAFPVMEKANNLLAQKAAA
jgi:hypothetical protein